MVSRFANEGGFANYIFYKLNGAELGALKHRHTPPKYTSLGAIEELRKKVKISFRMGGRLTDLPKFGGPIGTNPSVGMSSATEPHSAAL